jgi:DNA-binding NarL/FixJ family response regulator
MSPEIIVADDHPLYREALKSAVAGLLGQVTFVEASTVATLLGAVEAHTEADLLLLDLNMPGAHGFSSLALIRGTRPQLPVVVVSAMDDTQTIQSALAFGAQGFISKSADAAQIGAAVQAILAGEVSTPPGFRPHTTSAAAQDLEAARRIAELTPQQFRVLGMLCSGLLNKQIAYELGVSEATVKAHMTAILRKLGVSTRTQAALLVGRLSLDQALVKPIAEEPEASLQEPSGRT